ncbi:MAG: hypothetical protein QOE70_1640 [Chthoniobacter sp.]|jgi:hypothetical protein|nr:hypothetical protein [Chthoniobacter sp.]
MRWCGGIMPGSLVSPGFVVRGKSPPESLHSASRAMSPHQGPLAPSAKEDVDFYTNANRDWLVESS